jgi:hypothetical protein
MTHFTLRRESGSSEYSSSTCQEVQHNRNSQQRVSKH